MKTFAIALLLVATPAAAQDHPAIAGNYKAVAACTYKALDGFLPGAVRLTHLGDEIELAIILPRHGVPMRVTKATFRKVADNATALTIDDDRAAFGSVRGIATRCGGQ